MAKDNETPATFTVKELEIMQNVMLRGNVSTRKVVTLEEFDELKTAHGYENILHNMRADWLKENGHAVTRANMLDMSLLPDDHPALQK